MPKIEKRFAGHGVEIRKKDDGGSVIAGHASVFYNGTPETEYRLAQDYVERVAKTAFDNSLKRPDDVRGLFNHNANLILGRNKANTLRLSVDERGLRYEIDVPDSTIGRDLAESIKRGDVSGSSFSFYVTKQSFEEVGKTLIRTIEDVELFDVGPVTYPAYEGTDAVSRDAAPAFEARDKRRAEADAARQRIAASHRLADATARVVEIETKA